MIVSPIFSDLDSNEFGSPYGSHVQCCKNSEDKYIYLTFDDGPGTGTDLVIKQLKDNDVPATFFVLGSQLKESNRNKALLKEMAKNTKFLIGNHSNTHAKGVGYTNFYRDHQNEDGSFVLRDFRDCDTAISTVLGQQEKQYVYARLPGRNTWRGCGVTRTAVPGVTTAWDSASEANLLVENGYKVYGWDLEWHGPPKVKLETAENIFLQIEKLFDPWFWQSATAKENKLILLMHDIMFRSTRGGSESENDTSQSEQLGILIKKLKEAKYSFDLVSNY